MIRNDNFDLTLKIQTSYFVPPSSNKHKEYIPKCIHKEWHSKCSILYTININICITNTLHPLTWNTIYIYICCCSVAKLCLTLCNPMDCSMLGFPVLCYMLEFAQTHIHWIGEIQWGWDPNISSSVIHM